MESDDLAGAAALRWPVMPHAGDSAAAAVGALYQSHAVALIRLAYLMLGDRPSAEDAPRLRSPGAFLSLAHRPS